MEPVIRTFESVDEMFSWMRDNEEAANLVLAPEQQAVTYGSHWCRFFDIANRVVIFGKVLTQEEQRETETALADDSEADEAETEEILDTLAQSHERGYMYGRCYSTIEPDGEWGSTHRANLWPIPQHVYEAARDVRWDIDQLPPEQRTALEAAYQVYRTHLSGLGVRPVQ
jgi:hypothetical protein